MTMFAFNVATIIDNRFPHKIECLETWGSKLLLGTTESGLLVYDVKDRDTPDLEGFNVTVTEVYKNFSKGKPISQLNVIESHNIVISLCDGSIYVHDLPTFNYRTTISKAKGCNLYALNLAKTTPSICAAVKKKLYLFTWNGIDFVETKELAIPDVAKALVWVDTIYVGFKKEYSLIDASGNSLDIFPTGKTGNALATYVPPPEQSQSSRDPPPKQILLLKENVSILVGMDGKPTQKYGLPWTEPPIAIGFKYPYVISMQSRAVEVRMIIGNPTMVQNISHMKVLRENPLKCLTDKGDMYVATSNQVWRLVPIPPLQQIDQLIKDKDFEVAISLCENISSPEINKSEKLKQIRKLLAYNSFTQGQYERSMDIFSDLDVDPLEVIGLFPNLLPKTVRQKYVYPPDVPELVGGALDKAYFALFTFLVKKRNPFVQQLATAQSSNTPPVSMHNQDNVDYANCTDIPTIIDTSLLKAYIRTNEKFLEPLLRSNNFCHVRECQKVLTDYKKYNELVLLYKHKRLHREALELLQKLGSSNPVNAPLGGPTETINYLKALGKTQMPLIIEFSRWVLNVAPDDALSIFIEERNPQDRLPADQVLSLLKTTKPLLVIPYLEHILKNGEKGSDFHNELIFQYLDAIKILINDPLYQENKKGSPAGTETGFLGQTRKKLLKFLEESQYYNPEKMLSRFPVEDLFEERAILLSRIGQHDAALNIYAHKLKKFSMAEEYCAKHYNSEKEDARDVYLSLLRVYLRPPDGVSPMIQPAMNLLNKHYQRIDTPKALDLLPATIPIKELYPFFESVLRDITKNRRSNQVIKNLLKSENLQIREHLIKDRSHVIKITEDRSCPVCTKRLGTSVSCYVNGVVVHYMCLTSLQNQTQKKGAAVALPTK